MTLYATGGSGKLGGLEWAQRICAGALKEKVLICRRFLKFYTWGTGIKWGHVPP